PDRRVQPHRNENGGPLPSRSAKRNRRLRKIYATAILSTVHIDSDRDTEPTRGQITQLGPPETPTGMRRRGGPARRRPSAGSGGTASAATRSARRCARRT